MRKTLVIAVREYQAAVRTRTFVISLVIVPLMASAGLIAALVFRDQVDLDDRRFAVIDLTGRLFNDLSSAADEYNRTAIYDSEASEPGGAPKQVRPRFRLERADAHPGGLDELRMQLSRRVQRGELTGFVEIPAAAVDIGSGDDDPPPVVYRSNNPMYYEFEDWAAAQINRAVRCDRLLRMGLDPLVIELAVRAPPFRSAPLFTGTSGDGGGQGANSHYVRIATAVALGLLLFMVILVGAMPLTYSVLEEKIQRSAEMLLGSVNPFQFMMGKLLGMVGVSLTIVTIYLVVGFVVAWTNGYGHTIPGHLINWFVIYQAGAILMYGSIYIAIGAACGDMKDAQNLMTPASLVACIPLFLLRPVMLEPSSTFAVWVSLFPPATPVLMLIRQGLPAPVPVWQPVLGIVLVICTSILCVGVAARVFRVGILMQGKGADFRQIVRWALHRERRRSGQPARRVSDVATA